MVGPQRLISQINIKFTFWNEKYCHFKNSTLDENKLKGDQNLLQYIYVDDFLEKK